MKAVVCALGATQFALHEHLLGHESAIGEDICGGGRITIDERLQIYHHAYRARLRDALRDSFEKTWAYLGDANFDAAATAFVETHPPRHRNLRWYGADFAPWLTDEFPTDRDIGELAMMDWRLRGAFDGVDASPVAAAELARLDAADWESVGCRLAPTLVIEAVHFNTVAIWHALDRGETPPGASPLPEPAWLMIWRKQWQPHFRTIGTDEYVALAKLREGKALAAVCAQLSLAYSDHEAVLALARYVRAWIDEELIVELTGVVRASGPDA